MGIEPQKVNQPDIFIQQHIPPIGDRKSQTRSTYTETNALIFKDTFDLIIQSGFVDEYTIPYEQLGVTPQTLYVKITDALRWLYQNETLENGPYHQLRIKYHFKKLPNGILIKRSLKPLSKARAYQAVPLEKKTVVSFKITDSVTGQEIKAPPKQDIEEEPISTTVVKTWKDLVMEVLENDQFGVNIPIELSSKLSIEDQQWLNNLFAGVTDYGIDYAIDRLTIVIRKEKL